MKSDCSDFQNKVDALTSQLLHTDQINIMDGLVQDMWQLVRSAQHQGVLYCFPTQQKELLIHMYQVYLDFSCKSKNVQDQRIVLDPRVNPVYTSLDIYPYRITWAMGRDVREGINPMSVDEIGKEPEHDFIFKESVTSRYETSYMFSKNLEHKFIFFPILLNNQIYLWRPNKYPQVYSALLLLAYDQGRQAQFMTKSHLKNIIYLMQSMNLIGGFNTMVRGGGSVNDFHMQFFLPDFMPQELLHPQGYSDVRMPIEYYFERSVKLWSNDQLQINYYAAHEAMTGFEFSGINNKLIEIIMNLIDVFHQYNIFYNMIFYPNKISLFLVHPSKGPLKGFEFPGWLERLGILIASTEAQFNFLKSKAHINQVLQRVRYPEESILVDGIRYPAYQEIVSSVTQILS